MPSDREPIAEPFEIFSDNEVILTWRPATPAADDAARDEEHPKAA